MRKQTKPGAPDLMQVHHRLAAVSDDFFPVPPSPEANERINKELEKLRKRGNLLASSITFRKPEKVGLDDGLIYPGTVFPVGTTAAIARNAAADRAPLSGTVRVAVVLVNFTDRTIAQPASHFTDLFFSLGVVPTGSAREYYREVSNNIIDLQGEVVGPITLSHPMAFYANGESGIGNALPNASTMAQEAAQLANPLINFGNYDNDGDGFIDAYIVIHAGSGAEQTLATTDIWSHKSVLPAPFAADGKTIFAYLTVPEDARVGVCVHELGHLLFGFPDLYDTDKSSEGIGNWCLMAAGSWNGNPQGTRPAHPSAWCKMKQGWVTVINQSSNGNVSVPDVKSSHQIYRLWKNGAAGSEYFLVENRQQTGFDDHLPQGGLLVWHIDDAVDNNRNESHYKVALMQADGLRNLELKNNRGDAGDPYPGSTNKRTFTGSTTPNSKSYAGSDTCVAVTNIGDAAATMTARFQVRCKAIKEIKDKDKDIKDKDKDLKDKEIHKDVIKDKDKDLKDKEIHKELIKDKDKEFKEGKEVFEKPQPDKPVKENFEKPGGDGKFNEGKFSEGGLGGGFGGFGGGGGLAGPTTDLTGRVTALESRLSALEPFISQALRPDLVQGAYRQEDDQSGNTPLDMAGKQQLDSKVPDTM